MRSRAPRQATRGLLAALTTLTLLLLATSPAAAVPGPIGATPRTGANTDLVMTGTGAGQGVTGAIADEDNDEFDPTDGYPDEIPANFSPLDESFAGIIDAESVQTGEALQLYCIDIRTSTSPGIGYENGTWDESNVPNVGYVARILAEYYPATGEPSEAPNDNARAAAVQAAIWFFSDSYVLQPDDPVRPFTEAIVAAVLDAGQLPEPSPPNLVIDPDAATGPAGAPLGPFVISSDSDDPDLQITVSAEGGSMFSDAAGTVPIENGDSVDNGASVWLRPDDTTAGGTVTLSARGVAVAPSGSVYLYDGNTPGVNDAQRLILAQESEVSSLATAQAEFFQVSSLALTKTIAGPAAGEQGAITLHLSCDNGLEQDIPVPANAAAGDTTTTIEDLPVGTVCTATEPTDGSSSAISVTTQIDGSPATITADEVAGITLTNTYEFVLGSLALTKTIAGPAAGEQDAITLHLSCDNGLEQDIPLPANAPAGDTTTTIEDLPVGTVCTASEPTDGNTATISVSTRIEGNPATITADEIVGITLTNTYQEEAGNGSGGSGGEELADTGATDGWGSLAALSLALVLAGALIVTLERRSRAKVRNREP